MDWLFTLAGLAVGLLVGMTGVGGGALMTPLLVIGFNVPPIVAVGTDLLFAAATKTVGTLTHGWQGTVQWRLVALLASGSLPATLITLNYLSTLQAQAAVLDDLIRLTLGVALFLTAILLLLRDKILKFINKYPSKPNSLLITFLTVASGAALGVLVTVSSIGAGAIGIVIISLLYPKLPTVKVIGTDIAHAVPLTLIAGIGHFQLGSVDTHLLLLLLLGSIPGVYIGCRLSQYMPEKTIRVVLATILFGVSFTMMS